MSGTARWQGLLLAVLLFLLFELLRYFRSQKAGGGGGPSFRDVPSVLTPPPLSSEEPAVGKAPNLTVTVGAGTTGGKCDEDSLPRWSVERASLQGVQHQPPTLPRLRPDFAEGQMPGAVQSWAPQLVDCMLIERYFWGVHDGTFIELGAFDGLTSSNTVLMESALGWGGILVEGHKGHYASAVTRRPRSHVFNAACSAEWSKAGITFQGHGGSISHLPGKGAFRLLDEEAAQRYGAGAVEGQSTPLVTMWALTELFSCGGRLHI
eukprot:Hpha_TRINITY_DN17184_c0_g1::TRINITY_DN17184_c0_g1_i1::g.146681::m.146681